MTSPGRYTNGDYNRNQAPKVHLLVFLYPIKTRTYCLEAFFFDEAAGEPERKDVLIAE
jgi:hypothetical protein